MRPSPPRRLTAALGLVLTGLISGCSVDSGPGWTYVPVPTQATPAGTSGPGSMPVATDPSVPPAIAPPTVAPVPPTPSPAPTPVEAGGTVDVVMLDTMRFNPDTFSIAAGATVTFRIRNDGLLPHEFFVGTEEAQAEHAAEMAAGRMPHGHVDALRLEPGASGTLRVEFDGTGTLLAGCHEPGHYEAGMRASIEVVAS
ncbi:MAG TPA: plastocyanin/azurin family copper-binding protein [Candidatus Limnocylindrales bacterium]|nr:plastocyanin/azurin family copper-binding protein [Candidatus Limnocylindrales bacterium]